MKNKDQYNNNNDFNVTDPPTSSNPKSIDFFLSAPGKMLLQEIRFESFDFREKKKQQANIKNFLQTVEDAESVLIKNCVGKAILFIFELLLSSDTWSVNKLTFSQTRLNELSKNEARTLINRFFKFAHLKTLSFSHSKEDDDIISSFEKECFKRAVTSSMIRIETLCLYPVIPGSMYLYKNIPLTTKFYDLSILNVTAAKLNEFRTMVSLFFSLTDTTCPPKKSLSIKIIPRSGVRSNPVYYSLEKILLNKRMGNVSFRASVSQAEPLDEFHLFLSRIYMQVAAMKKTVITLSFLDRLKRRYKNLRSGESAPLLHNNMQSLVVKENEALNCLRKKLIMIRNLGGDCFRIARAFSKIHVVDKNTKLNQVPFSVRLHEFKKLKLCFTY
eukprot:snap_masked-scaffold_8-processed-gene-5.30-mRNA-1 protein AED:1.00 eAED:1.00 QI:0/-1/0/0/-1/1/1/0/385